MVFGCGGVACIRGGVANACLENEKELGEGGREGGREEERERG